MVIFFSEVKRFELLDFNSIGPYPSSLVRNEAQRYTFVGIINKIIQERSIAISETPPRISDWVQPNPPRIGLHKSKTIITMQHAEAIHLIKTRDIHYQGNWVDLGAGAGTFSYALHELVGTNGQLYAVDKSPNLITHPDIISIRSDFKADIDLPPLDGILMANALHFVRKQKAFLQQWLEKLSPGGIFLLIEYDRKIGSPWVPFPISFQKFEQLCQQANLSAPIEIGRKKSIYGNGEIYSAWARKEGSRA